MPASTSGCCPLPFYTAVKGLKSPTSKHETVKANATTIKKKKGGGEWGLFLWHPEAIIQSLLLFVQCFYFALCEDWPLIGAVADGPKVFLTVSG